MDVLLTKTFQSKFTFGFTYADFSTDPRNRPDTEKLWIWFQVKI